MKTSSQSQNPKQGGMIVGTLQTRVQGNMKQIKKSGREQKSKVCLDSLREIQVLTAGLQGSRGEENSEITKLRKKRYRGNR